MKYPEPKVNTKETLDKLSKIEGEVDRKVEEILNDMGIPQKLGYCHVFWNVKKRLLKEEYCIDWFSPAECNPHIIYD